MATVVAATKRDRKKDRMTDEQDLVRKISALLKKAEGTDNENEASAFFAKANELMLKHSIDEAQVRANAQARGEVTTDPVQVYWMWATHDAHAKAKATLIAQIAQSQHVRFVNFDNKPGSNRFREGNEGKYSQWCSLIGFPEDIANVKVMYASLLIQWARFVRQDVKVWREAPKPETSWWDEKPVKEYGFKTGHLEGFAYRVGARLRLQEQEVVAAYNANALMVLKDDAITQWVASKTKPNWYDKYCLDYNYSQRKFCGLLKDHEPVKGTRSGHVYTIKAGRSRSTRDVDQGGFASGQAAGSQADITRPSTKIGG